MSDFQNWFYMDKERQEQGPISSEKLQDLVSRLVILKKTLVWTAGLSEWVPASKVGGLFEHQPKTQVTVAKPQQHAAPMRVEAIQEQVPQPPLMVASAPMIASTPTTAPTQAVPATTQVIQPSSISKRNISSPKQTASVPLQDPATISAQTLSQQLEQTHPLPKISEHSISATVPAENPPVIPGTITPNPTSINHNTEVKPSLLSTPGADAHKPQLNVECAEQIAAKRPKFNF